MWPELFNLSGGFGDEDLDDVLEISLEGARLILTEKKWKKWKKWKMSKKKKKKKKNSYFVDCGWMVVVLFVVVVVTWGTMREGVGCAIEIVVFIVFGGLVFMLFWLFVVICGVGVEFIVVGGDVVTIPFVFMLFRSSFILSKTSFNRFWNFSCCFKNFSRGDAIF